MRKGFRVEELGFGVEGLGINGLRFGVKSSLSSVMSCIGCLHAGSKPRSKAYSQCLGRYEATTIHILHDLGILEYRSSQGNRYFGSPIRISFHPHMMKIDCYGYLRARNPKPCKP